LGAVDPTVEAEGLLGPEAADDRDRLLEAGGLVPRGADAQPEGAVLVVGRAATETEDQPSAREPVERLGHLGDHRRVAVRHAEDPGRDADPRRRRGDVAEQGPRLVGGARSTGVVRGRDEVEAELLGADGGCDRVCSVRGRGRNIESELQLRGVGDAHGRSHASGQRYVSGLSQAARRICRSARPSLAGPSASGERSITQNEASTAGPMPTANATVPTPTVPPRTRPTPRAQSSIAARTTPMRKRVRRAPTTISESRGPAPRSAPM